MGLEEKTYIYHANQLNVGKYTIAPWMVWVMVACEVSYTYIHRQQGHDETRVFELHALLRRELETGRVGPKAGNKRRSRDHLTPIVINGWFFRDGWGIEPQMDFQLPWYLVSCNATCFTWRIIPRTDGPSGFHNPWLVRFRPRVVGPLPNGRTPWLIHGGDPNYLLSGMILHLAP